MTKKEILKDETVKSFLEFLEELIGPFEVTDVLGDSKKHRFKLSVDCDNLGLHSWYMWRVEGIWFAEKVNHAMCVLINGVWGSLDFRFSDQRKSDD